MRGSKTDWVFKGPSTGFSSKSNRVSKNSSLILLGLLVSCVFLLRSGTDVWSFDAPEEISSAQGSRTAASGSDGPWEGSLSSTFRPFEIAQISPGRVQIYEGEQDSNKESRLQFSENKMKQAGFIVPETSSVGTIIKNFNHYNVFTLGEIVYLDVGSEQGASKGDLFAVFSKVRPIVHPVIKGEKVQGLSNNVRLLGEPTPPYFTRNGKMMGHLVHPIGYLEILESTTGSSKAIIRESYSPIKNGDFIAPYEKPSTPPRLPEVRGEEKLEGYVIAYKRQHHMGALNDILYLDIGSDHKVIPGDRFEVFVTPKKTSEKWNQFTATEVPLIPIVVAEVQVLDTQRQTSTAIVISGFHSIPLGAALRYKPVDIVSAPLENVAALQSAPGYEWDVREIPLEFPLDNSLEPEVEEPFAGLDPDSLADADPMIQETELLTFVPTDDLKDVYFQFDKFDLDEVSKQILLANVEYMIDHPNIQTQIQGHCDERGTNNYNLALGERRATSIRKFMLSQGIAEHRLHLISYGEENPFCHESDENCWRENRRVHFQVSGSDLPVN